ncbi:MAG TPA: hypothetical protein VFH31_16400, partial [Pyrinomonadaceae bacterium]|nr:hypothetical protein [Pyrinomonadaceae bacterium]
QARGTAARNLEPTSEIGLIRMKLVETASSLKSCPKAASPPARHAIGKKDRNLTKVSARAFVASPSCEAW